MQPQLLPHAVDVRLWAGNKHQYQFADLCNQVLYFGEGSHS